MLLGWVMTSIVCMCPRVGRVDDDCAFVLGRGILGARVSRVAIACLVFVLSFLLVS